MAVTKKKIKKKVVGGGEAWMRTSQRAYKKAAKTAFDLAGKGAWDLPREIAKKVVRESRGAKGLPPLPGVTRLLKKKKKKKARRNR
jgi:hypothetical protein